jgi:hypothetical protein
MINELHRLTWYDILIKKRMMRKTSLLSLRARINILLRLFDVTLAKQLNWYVKLQLLSTYCEHILEFQIRGLGIGVEFVAHEITL